MKKLVVALVLALAVIGGAVSVIAIAHHAAAGPCSDGSNNCKER